MKRFVLSTILSLIVSITFSATRIVYWNPPTGSRQTYSDSKKINGKNGDVLKFRVTGNISNGSYIYLWLKDGNGVRTKIFSYTTPNVSFDKTDTYAFTSDSEYTVEYEYYRFGGGSAYTLDIYIDLISSESSDFQYQLKTDDVINIGNFRYRYNGEFLVLTQNNIYNYSGNVEIPSSETYRGYTYDVKGIASYALQNQKNIQGISIPKSISLIEANAFGGCSSLSSITIFSDELTICSGAFSGCNSISDIYLRTRTIPILSQQEASVFTTDVINKSNLHVYKSIEEELRASSGWNNFENIKNQYLPIEKILVNISNNSIHVGDSIALDIKVLPTDASDEMVECINMTPNIVKLNNRIITAIHPGIAEIRIVSQENNEITSNVRIIVPPSENCGNYGHEYVDLGLPSGTLWATCNIGAKTPKDYGNYFAWGEITGFDEGKTDFSWKTYKYCNGSKYSITKYNKADAELEETDDAAYVLWGEMWRMPSLEQIKEITNPEYTTLQFVIDNDSIGYVITSKFNNRSIFFPLAGRSDGYMREEIGAYWTKTNSSDGYAYELYFRPSEGSPCAGCGGYRCEDRSIRPVIDKHNIVIAQSIKIFPIDIKKGEIVSLPIEFTPSNTFIKTISLYSDNSNVVKITQDGKIEGVSTGSAVITATTTDGSNLSSSCVVTVTNPVNSLALDKTHYEMMAGQQVTLFASCLPSDADNTTITWRSSDNLVACVENGVVTANKVGDAIITASSVNGIEATCSISVVPTPVSSLQLNETSISIVKDQEFTLVCTVSPNDATNKEVIWYSQNENIAKVNEYGQVTGVATGETTIIVSAKSDSNKTAICKVKVTTPITAIQLDYSKYDLYVEDNLQLHATCTPSSADDKNVEWTSSNTNIAVVSSNGYVTTKNEGEVRITATTKDGTKLSASCDITVKKIKQAIIWEQELQSLLAGGELITLYASSSSGLPVSFSSSDKKVLSIFDLGEVVYANPVGCGNSQIIASQSGNYKYESVELKKDIEVIGKPVNSSKTLIAYYAQSTLLDGIVAELANQIVGQGSSVHIQKIEPTNNRLNEANINKEVRDSVMDVIWQYPNDIMSYPSINNIGANLKEYDDVIMVYPLWNSIMAAPMQTFCFTHSDVLKNKFVAYIEYDLFGDAGVPSNVKALRLDASNIEDKEQIIKEWLKNSEATGILQLRKDRNKTSEGIYDMQGRKLQRKPNNGIYIIKGHKVEINNGRARKKSVKKDY